MLEIIEGSVKSIFFGFPVILNLFPTHITNELLNLLPKVFVSVTKKLREHSKLYIPSTLNIDLILWHQGSTYSLVNRPKPINKKLWLRPINQLIGRPLVPQYKVNV